MPLRRMRSGWLVVQDFDGVAVEDGDDGAGEVGGNSRANEPEPEDYCRCSSSPPTGLIHHVCFATICSVIVSLVAGRQHGNLGGLSAQSPPASPQDITPSCRSMVAMSK